MKIVFVFLLVIFLAFSGYHLTFRRLKLPLFATKFYLRGTEFLFLGLLLGPHFLNILDTETQHGLDLFCALLLGWVGLLFGFQFEYEKLRRFPLEFLQSAIIQGIVTFIFIFSGIYFTISSFSEIPEMLNIVISLVVSAAGMCTSQTGLALLSPDYIAGNQNKIMFMRFISSFDGLAALVIYSFAFFFRQRLLRFNPDVFDIVVWMLKCAGASFALLILYTLFFTRRREENELGLIVIGMSILSSGTASMLDFSPLLVNFFVGLGLVNLSIEKERIYNILFRVEKPVYLLLLVFLGIHLQLDSLLFLMLAGGYFGFRILGKYAGGYLSLLLTPPLKQNYSRYFGLGLLEQGGLPLAIMLDFNRGFPFDISVHIITVVLITVIFNDLFSIYLLRYVLTEK